MQPMFVFFFFENETVHVWQLLAGWEELQSCFKEFKPLKRILVTRRRRGQDTAAVSARILYLAPCLWTLSNTSGISPKIPLLKNEGYLKFFSNVFHLRVSKEISGSFDESKAHSINGNLLCSCVRALPCFLCLS